MDSNQTTPNLQQAKGAIIRLNPSQVSIKEAIFAFADVNESRSLNEDPNNIIIQIILDPSISIKKSLHLILLIKTKSLHQIP